MVGRRRANDGNDDPIDQNKVPGLENGCFFTYAEDTVGERAEKVMTKRK